MSVLRPIDDDYVTRGIFLLIGWMFVGPPLLAIPGALLAGAGGAAVGFVLAIPVGIWGYNAYLNYGRRQILAHWRAQMMRVGRRGDAV